MIKAYFEQQDTSSEKAFEERKTFNELAGKLAALFNQRRNGNNWPEGYRSSRRYPPMFETHPYLRRDESDRRSAVFQAKSDFDDTNKGLPGEPWLSESLARKRLIGQIAKREFPSSRKLPTWWVDSQLEWDFATPENLDPGSVESWVNNFDSFLDETYQKHNDYYGKIRPSDVKEARSVREIADASLVKGFVAYIYADGNNMGGYIQKEIKNPEDYQRFSRDIFEATEKSVYVALAKHLKPHKYKPDAESGRRSKEEVWIHPFEILTIGGDDVMLIVPAERALAIAKTIGEEFEKQLLDTPEKQRRYSFQKTYAPQLIHRYRGDRIPSGSGQCKLSMSTGVLIAAENTPIYYAQKLTEQLLKSAKKRAKELKKDDYLGGTIDFLVMKSVTMISSNIGEFRSQGLTKNRRGQPTLKLYGAPYTLYEIEGLLKTAKALKDSEFPRSQIYQIRSLLEQGKHTAILNYLYFQVRLKTKEQKNLLKTEFDRAWCQPKDPKNKGNLAPWMTLKEDGTDAEKMTYETIWRELVDLYPFIEDTKDKSGSKQQEQTEVNS
ncbi:type III-B CRISPR-associated protein Cas10/Cmr2 [Microcoleus sp. BROC3]|uniref:type III-B CRISPR-associated protein Cas10/Cmr2 n=1 Tax=Microcoleus sp. BROC3 TaxID=3055323 RepID=UPI002FD686F3